MKVAIAGAGAVGTFVANDLREANHEIVLIEKNPDLAARLRPTLDVQWFVGDACEVANLQEAGIADADVMVAATGEDQVNLVISLLAKQEFAVPRVVARVNNPKNQWMFNEMWGVDVSVSTEKPVPSTLCGEVAPPMAAARAEWKSTSERLKPGVLALERLFASTC